MSTAVSLPGRLARPRGTVALATLSFLLLFAGFRWNVFRAADPFFFALNQTDTEALVLGRMVWSRQRGFFAGAGLLGFVGIDRGVVTFDTTELWILRPFDLQSQAYLEGRQIRSFSPYFSHSGLQGSAFAALDGVLSPAAPAFRLDLFHTLTATLVAAAYAALIVWIRREFGFLAALLSFLVVAVSPWLTASARNLYLSLWLFLLPALAIGAVLSIPSARSNQNLRLVIVAFVALLVRFLSGYEYMTVTAAMVTAPLVYYAIRDTWPLRVLFRRLGLVAGAAVVALTISLAVLTLQITAATGSASEALTHIGLAIGRRTSGDPSRFPPIYAAALSVRASDVLRTYTADRFDRRNPRDQPAPFRWLLSRRYGDFIVGIVLASGWVAARTRRRPVGRRSRPLALAAATLCALLGVFAWLIVFKAHSFFHGHVSPVMWHLLFLPLGAALFAIAFEDAAVLLGRTLGLTSALRGRAKGM